MTPRRRLDCEQSIKALLPVDRVRRIRRRLLNWYDRSARDLPWRRPDASVYGKWVAEIMLQQTRVDTVLGYYDAFLQRFPMVETLAAARLADVLTVWQGLGYYRRAENLHRAARIVAERGRWPGTPQEWLDLPGIGPYTAGALASMAQGFRVPAVDGNVRRVLARLLPVAEQVASPTGERLINAAATMLLPARQCGDFNQAWMDLASAICLPRNPNCPRCPLAGECAAKAGGHQHRWPLTKAKPQPVPVDRLAVAFMQGGRVLLVQRPQGGRWSNLWELPNCELIDTDTGRSSPGGDTPASTNHSAQVVNKLAADLAIPRPPQAEFLQVIRHQLTHRTYQFHLYRAELPSVLTRKTRKSGRRWVSPRVTGRIPISTAQRKLIHALSEAPPV